MGKHKLNFKWTAEWWDYFLTQKLISVLHCSGHKAYLPLPVHKSTFWGELPVRLCVCTWEENRAVASRAREFKKLIMFWLGGTLTLAAKEKSWLHSEEQPGCLIQLCCSGDSRSWLTVLGIAPSPLSTISASWSEMLLLMYQHSIIAFLDSSRSWDHQNYCKERKVTVLDDSWPPPTSLYSPGCHHALPDHADILGWVSASSLISTQLFWIDTNFQGHTDTE